MEDHIQKAFQFQSGWRLNITASNASKFVNWEHGCYFLAEDTMPPSRFTKKQILCFSLLILPLLFSPTLSSSEIHLSQAPSENVQPQREVQQDLPVEAQTQKVPSNDIDWLSKQEASLQPVTEILPEPNWKIVDPSQKEENPLPSNKLVSKPEPETLTLESLVEPLPSQESSVAKKIVALSDSLYAPLTASDLNLEVTEVIKNETEEEADFLSGGLF
jgi:hypothetical protein